jgi:hypothetical protein
VRVDHEQIDRLPILAQLVDGIADAGVSVNVAEGGNAPASLLTEFAALAGDVCRIASVDGRPERFECGQLGVVVGGERPRELECTWLSTERS